MNIGGYEYWHSKNLPVDRVSYIVGRTDQRYDKRGTKNHACGLCVCVCVCVCELDLQ
jgi:hypothetical protein